MDTTKSVDVLNKLVEINNDRIEGYESASKETDDNDLKTLFAGFIMTSKKCRQELVNEVVSLGGKPTEGTRTTGKMYRAWMDVKAALTGKDRKAILDSCEYGEDVAVDTYDEVINEDFGYLSQTQQSFVVVQRNNIKADHDKVKTLRNQLEHA